MKLSYQQLNERGSGVLFPDTMEDAVRIMKNLNKKRESYKATLTVLDKELQWDNKKRMFV